MREKIKLVSSAGTGHFYTTNKNKRNTPEKIEIKKKRSRSKSMIRLSVSTLRTRKPRSSNH